MTPPVAEIIVFDAEKSIPEMTSSEPKKVSAVGPAFYVFRATSGWWNPESVTYVDFEPAGAVWEDPIPARQVNDSTAKSLIRDLIGKETGLDELVISERLALDIETVFRLCGELVEEGKIRSISSNE